MPSPPSRSVRVRARHRRLVVLAPVALLLALATAALAVAAPSAGSGDGGPQHERRSAAVGTAADRVEHDVRYGPAPAQTLDVVLPAPGAAAGRARGPGRTRTRARARRAGAGAPAVLLVHGGGWFAGDKQRMAGVAAQLAAAGFVVFNVNYTLATRERPGHPVQVRELRQALRWIGAHGAAFGADPARLAALGSSAGGNLVALVATTQRPAAPRIRAAVTWSAPLDLPALTAQPGQLRGLVATYTGCRARWCAPRVAAASPLAHVTPDDPPLLLVNARAELVPTGQARRMAAALDAVGVERELLLLGGAGHGRELAPAALAPSIAFLRRHLR